MLLIVIGIANLMCAFMQVCLIYYNPERMIFHSIMGIMNACAAIYVLAIKIYIDRDAEIKEILKGMNENES